MTVVPIQYNQMSPKKVIVVGGGAIGAGCAYYLSKSGCDVTILDRDQFGCACSHGNCGLVSMSHVLPLCQPGAVKRVMKAMTQRNSPFRVRPGLRFDLWWWLWQFTRRCNERDMLKSARARAALLASTGELYRDLIETESLDCEWETRGCLFVYQSQQSMNAYAKLDELLRQQFDVGAKRLDDDQLHAFEPALKPGCAAGGFLYEMDANLRPDRLLSSWRQALERRGVVIRDGCEVKSFVRRESGAVAVKTSEGEVSADSFVIATGAWTPMLNRQLGCRVPIQPGKGYSITMPRPEICPAAPMIFQDHKVAVTPMQSGYRLGSTMEFAGYDNTIDRRRLALLRDGASVYLRDDGTQAVEEEWFGWRPMTCDGVPIIDRSPIMDNVFIAAGHNMIGLTLAPSTGKLVAELVTGQATHVDPAMYGLGRS